MNEYAEKREFFRMGIDCPAQFRVQGADNVDDGIVKNLSASGLLILASQEISPGTHLRVRIVPVNKITPPLSAHASVLRSQPAETGDYEIACSIDQILSEEEAGPDFP
jgi:hypothetical protein